MFKKIIIMGVLALSLVVMLNIAAHAYPTRLGGWSVGFGSVCVDSTWVGVGNPEKIPSYVQVAIYPSLVQVQYMNPGGNIGGVGEPFTTSAVFTGVEVFDPQHVTKNGKYESSVCFDLNADNFDPSTFPPPPNPKWEPYKIIVLEMYVEIIGYSLVNDDPDTPVAHVIGKANLNCEGTDYAEYTLDQWAWKNNSPYDLLADAEIPFDYLPDQFPRQCSN